MSSGLSFLRGVLEQDRNGVAFLPVFGLKREDFVDEEAVVLRYVLKHVRKYGILPEFTTIKRRFKEVSFPPVSNEPLLFWADQVKARKLSEQIRTQFKDVFRALRSGNPENAIATIRELSIELAREDNENKVETLQELANEVLRLHDVKQQTMDSKPRIPYGFKHLDAVSGGAQPGDTLAIIGFTGLGKTYFMCRMAVAAHAAGCSVLFVSLEMNTILIARRLVSLRTHLNENFIKRGELSTLEGRQKLVQNLSTLPSERPFYLIDGRLVLRIEDLDAYVRALKPDIVYIDGAYMLKSKASARGKWEGISDAAEQVKSLAGAIPVPIVETFQFNETGGVWGGKSPEFLASIVLHFLPDDDDRASSRYDSRETRLVEIKKGRGGEYGKFRVIYDMFRMEIEQAELLPYEKRLQHERKKRRRVSKSDGG